jgi:hypothetical protein
VSISTIPTATVSSWVPSPGSARWYRLDDLPCVQIKKSDDLDNACAKSQVLQVLLAQALAMQIIPAPALRGLSIRRLRL